MTLEIDIEIHIPVTPRFVKCLNKNNSGILIPQSLTTSTNIEYLLLPEPWNKPWYIKNIFSITNVKSVYDI